MCDGSVVYEFLDVNEIYTCAVVLEGDFQPSFRQAIRVICFSFLLLLLVVVNSAERLLVSTMRRTVLYSIPAGLCEGPILRLLDSSMQLGNKWSKIGGNVFSSLWRICVLPSTGFTSGVSFPSNLSEDVRSAFTGLVKSGTLLISF